MSRRNALKAIAPPTRSGVIASSTGNSLRVGGVLGTGVFSPRRGYLAWPGRPGGEGTQSGPARMPPANRGGERARQQQEQGPAADNGPPGRPSWGLHDRDGHSETDRPTRRARPSVGAIHGDAVLRDDAVRAFLGLAALSHERGRGRPVKPLL